MPLAPMRSKPCIASVKAKLVSCLVRKPNYTPATGRLRACTATDFLPTPSARLSRRFKSIKKSAARLPGVFLFLLPGALPGCLAFAARLPGLFLFLLPGALPGSCPAAARSRGCSRCPAARSSLCRWAAYWLPLSCGWAACWLGVEQQRGCLLACGWAAGGLRVGVFGPHCMPVDVF